MTLSSQITFSKKVGAINSGHPPLVFQAWVPANSQKEAVSALRRGKPRRTVVSIKSSKASQNRALAVSAGKRSLYEINYVLGVLD